MTSLLSLYHAANPGAKTEEINRAVKRKFLQGISDNLRHNLFMFCSNPYDEKVSCQDVLKACLDAIVHLSIKQSPDPFLLASDSVLLAAAAPIPQAQLQMLYFPWQINLRSNPVLPCLRLTHNNSKSMPYNSKLGTSYSTSHILDLSMVGFHGLTGNLAATYVSLEAVPFKHGPQDPLLFDAIPAMVSITYKEIVLLIKSRLAISSSWKTSGAPSRGSFWDIPHF